jgi:uncharacterized RDD family membrane protein YckC
MGRFRYIAEDGQEIEAEDVPELVTAVQSGRLREGQLIFDKALEKWEPSEQHDAVAAALASLARPSAQTASRVDSAPSAANQLSKPPASTAAAGKAAQLRPSANRRMLARFLDWLLLGTLGGIGLALAGSALWGLPSDDTAPVVFALYNAAGMTILDIVCTRVWAATPGKMLLKMRVISIDRSAITLGQAAQRSALLWIRGLAFGIPILSLVTAAVSMRRVARGTGKTSWDDMARTDVQLRAA